ncbi:transmembrane protein 179B-like [Babylonia areolata]|uniref:transmembrane protein 179B-like n=1 Tax=Babylonia areolata TaxID=304850 RepID=UPI003FCF0400
MADLSKFVEYAKSFFLQRAAGYCLIVLSSLFVIAPLGVLQTQLDQQCLLYADVVHELQNVSAGALPRGSFRFRFGPPSVCEYSLAVSALFSLLYPLVMIGVHVFAFLREKRNKDTDLGQVWFLVHGVVEVVVVVLVLVSACTISHGFTSLCSDITDVQILSRQLDKCSDAQQYKWGDYDVSNFYVCLSVATAGSWFQFVFWLLQAAFVMWKLWRLNMLPVCPDWMKPGSSG